MPHLMSRIHGATSITPPPSAAAGESQCGTAVIHHNSSPTPACGMASHDDQAQRHHQEVNNSAALLWKEGKGGKAAMQHFRLQGESSAAQGLQSQVGRASVSGRRGFSLSALL